MRPGQAQRAERRGPEKADAGGIAHLAEIPLVHVDLAAVDEGREAQRAVRLRPGHREQDLRDADDLAIAAGRVAELVERSERERAIAAHRARAAGEEVLEEGQRLRAVAAGEPDLSAEVQRERARQRPVPLVLVTQPVIL